MGDNDELPDLPFEVDIGTMAIIQQDWWHANPDALSEVVELAAWDDISIERRNADDSTGPPPQRLTLTVEEAADILGISRAFAYESVRRGDIPCIRIGRRVLVPKVALDKMLEGA